MTDEPTTPIADAEAEHLVETYGPETMTDADLIAAHQRTSGRSSDAEADALAAEMERRGLPR